MNIDEALNHALDIRNKINDILVNLDVTRNDLTFKVKLRCNIESKEVQRHLFNIGIITLAKNKVLLDCKDSNHLIVVKGQLGMAYSENDFNARKIQELTMKQVLELE